MSEETKVKLIRQDKFNKLDSHTNIYNVALLSSFNEEEKSTILKIIKKVILGSNFTYFYSIIYLVWQAISDILIIYSFIVFNLVILDLLYLNIFFILIALIISLISIVVFFILFYKSKKKKINNYMKNSTEYSIKVENNILLKNKLFCEISKDDFDILIKETDKDLDLGIKNEDIFFEYVINFHNGNDISKYLYIKALSNKENEIINNINAILKEIVIKYQNKFMIYVTIILGVFAVCLLFYLNKPEKKILTITNTLVTLSLIYFIKIKIYFKIKKDNIKSVSSLNEKYFKDGYYIYINNDIVSIIYLKEELRINNDISKIKEIIEKFIKKVN